MYDKRIKFDIQLYLNIAERFPGFFLQKDSERQERSSAFFERDESFDGKEMPEEKRTSGRISWQTKERRSGK